MKILDHFIQYCTKEVLHLRISDVINERHLQDYFKALMTLLQT